MSFFSHIRHLNRYNPYSGSAYYQQPPMQPQYQNPQMATPTLSCSQCHGNVAMGSKFCPFCGIEIKPNIAVTCNDCGSIIQGRAKFCSGCGKKV